MNIKRYWLKNKREIIMLCFVIPLIVGAIMSYVFHTFEDIGHGMFLGGIVILWLYALNS